MKLHLRVAVAAGLLAFVAWDSSPAASLVRQEWQVGGVTREALVYAPDTAKTDLAPVVFAFHGHGGSMHNAARTFSYHTRWPEAIVVYMQGLKTPGRLTDPEGRLPGWQKDFRDQDDRDLKFFDEVLTSLKQKYKVDQRRIYATGHSNGGAFTFLLWAARGDDLAAVAPCAAAAGPNLLRKFNPKPVFQLAGESDPLVKFTWQKATLDAVLKLNQCGEGKPGKPHCTLYESKVGAPVLAYIHQGGHTFPTEAAGLIIEFFAQHPRP